MSERPLVLATRRSALALAQAEIAGALLRARHPGRAVELLPMTTTGDERLQWSLEKEGGKGLFTSELERAVLEGQADYAIHSGKDLPTEFMAGLEIVGYLAREDPRDVLVLREELGDAPPGTIASASPRRRAQVSKLFPEASWTEIRGNVQTRLRKLVEGHADATLLAAAGLNRLGVTSHPGLVFRPLDYAACVPATAQGAIAIQGRAGEGALWEGCICERTTRDVLLEREVLSLLGGGCHSASAAFVHEGVLLLFHASLGRHELPLGDVPPDFASWIEGLRREA
jgi:hydroxymethylbilane synthase